MGQTELMVLSRPPEGLAAADYDAWYDTHVSELLARVDEFTEAQRFHLRFTRASSDAAVPYSYLTRYTVAGDFEAAMRSLRAAVDSGELTFPDWYEGVESAGWECLPWTG
jgi:hypothetical protein